MEKEKDCKSCIDCGILNCNKMDKSYPEFCLTTHMKEELLKESMDLYGENEENFKIAQAAAQVEAENYCKMTRIEEIVEFAKKMGVEKIGIATCVGLMAESRIAAKIFKLHGFTVCGIACKIGAQPKTKIGLPVEKCQQVGLNMCNPILQAKTLNEQHTDLNVVVGLCVGHDSLFYKYSEAIVTTLITKDRVLGHNPAAALYQINSYYSRLLDVKDHE
ncbi:MAG: DUF1847 domain-containing protein [Anaerovorax sp.]